VELGDDVRYAVKGQGTITFQLELGSSLDALDVLYILVLKKTFLSVSTMKGRGFSVTFHRGKVLIRPKKYIPDNVVVVGVREGTLYRLWGKPIQDLVYKSDNLCELCNRRLGHLHYREWLIMREIVTVLPKFGIE
jgi:hypothetical protein